MCVCTYIQICMCVCMYVCSITSPKPRLTWSSTSVMYVCMYVFMFTSIFGISRSTNIDVHTMHAYHTTYVHTYVHTCIHTYIHTYIHTCTHTYLPACMHLYISLSIYVCGYMYIYVHTDTCICVVPSVASIELSIERASDPSLYL